MRLLDDGRLQEPEQDFDVFLVGDATIATFPAHDSPRFATTAAVSFAALNLFITQASWVKPVAASTKTAEAGGSTVQPLDGPRRSR